jgi:hypothetical protein
VKKQIQGDPRTHGKCGRTQGPITNKLNKHLRIILGYNPRYNECPQIHAAVSKSMNKQKNK